ncbi:MAG: tRNA (5-methylaminomethyl-2-thiouridine)(34)-methyltransferase MnmD [Chryseolinea sp.]
MPVTIITTADGSHSLLNEFLQETYHSIHGALQESKHVFIQAGMEHWLDIHQTDSISIFEVGFGTGLNAWLAWRFARARAINMTYTSIESFPLEESIWKQLNYVKDEADKSLFASLHESAWDITVRLDDGFSLHKMNLKLEDATVEPNSIDVIFYDAFAPSKQPDMWTFAILQKTVSVLKKGGVFVTYCAKGQLKRDLKSLNLVTEGLPGPPGKKEIIRGTKN